ncbi:mannitol dehydrogenase family protein [Anianabacter salinae]|uniref:mannitol dehydrogenase family protein n=1 Tax=Anianabacter salinae TaxID=2851023 RepID=UPI00225E1A36|nr:mannitol dehydrogenase family protein [Anianabacter salinae]MBV0912218.1 mannitol dehydrogenase family protein [Anianabacter salinae]
MPADGLVPQGAVRPATGIVHLGLGAFFRGFGCVYVADAMAASGGDWGIVGVSLRSPGTRDALRGQDWAYTSVTLDGAAETVRRIEVLNEVLVAPEDPEAVLAAMADPGVRIVSLTVTEKGYCHNPATGRLNLDHPDIRHDLAHALPVSAPGFLVRALERRRVAGSRPFTVLSCDNLPENGRVLRGVVLDLARAIDPALADWIASDGRFPCTMVDRITPATTPDDIARIDALTGTPDAAPVLHEPFSQWAVEDDFVDGARPDLAAAGAEMVADVTAHEHMKLRMLNGTHSALAYTGYLAGHQTIADTVADPVLAAYARTLWSEIMPAVTAPAGVSLPDYADALLARYANPAIRHRTWQIAMDGSQKLPQRLLGTLRDNLAAARASPALCLAVAAWMRYAGGIDETGGAIDVRDPLADDLRALSENSSTPAEVVRAILSLRAVFPADLAADLQAPLTEAAERLWSVGASAAVQEVSA